MNSNRRPPRRPPHRPANAGDDGEPITLEQLEPNAAAAELLAFWREIVSSLCKHYGLTDPERKVDNGPR